MTSEEALQILDTIPTIGEQVDALELAIKALEQEPFINKPCVSKGVCEHDKNVALDKIRAEIANLDDADYDYEGYYKAVTDALKIIDKYKAERVNNG